MAQPATNLDLLDIKYQRLEKLFPLFEVDSEDSQQLEFFKHCIKIFTVGTNQQTQIQFSQDELESIEFVKNNTSNQELHTSIVQFETCKILKFHEQMMVQIQQQLNCFIQIQEPIKEMSVHCSVFEKNIDKDLTVIVNQCLIREPATQCFMPTYKLLLLLLIAKEKYYCCKYREMLKLEMQECSKVTFEPKNPKLTHDQQMQKMSDIMSSNKKTDSLNTQQSKQEEPMQMQDLMPSGPKEQKQTPQLDDKLSSKGSKQNMIVNQDQLLQAPKRPGSGKKDTIQIKPNDQDYKKKETEVKQRMEQDFDQEMKLIDDQLKEIQQYQIPEPQQVKMTDIKNQDLNEDFGAFNIKAKSDKDQQQNMKQPQQKQASVKEDIQEDKEESDKE